MNSQQSWLLIDAGNTRLKFALVESSGYVNANQRLDVYDANQVHQLVDEMNRKNSKKPFKVVLASVRNEQLTQVLIDQLHRAFTSIEVNLITPEQGFMGVECAYQDLTQIGVDRWLALLAAVAVFDSKHVLVVDCGTAMTIDQLNGNRHLGGWIFPGIQMLSDCLYQKTGRVRAHPQEVRVSSASELLAGFGTNTKECVRAASHQGVLGLLFEAIHVASATQELDGILLTGGDGAALAERSRQRCGCPVVYYEQLVFQGMLQWLTKKV